MKVMKKVLTGSMIALMVLFLSAGLGLAGNGKGPGDGTGPDPLHFVIEDSDFTITGQVSALAPGEGLIIATDSESITIYGIGPVKYWDSQDVVRPAVGDSVTVDAYQVDYNGEIRNIATSITVGNDTVELRESDGLPLWRGQKKGQVQE